MEIQTFISQDFELILPKDWGRKVIATFFEPPTGGLQKSVVITQEILTEPCSVEEYVKRQIDELTKQLGSFKLEEKGKANTQTATAPQILFTWTPPGSSPVTQCQVFILQNLMVWTITGTTSKGNFESFKPIFQEVVQSFRFRNGSK